jgi:hypothetical protein
MAISDVLAQAVDDIDDYLKPPSIYSEGELRARIVSVRDAMDALRRELDSPAEMSHEGRSEFDDG